MEVKTAVEHIVTHFRDPFTLQGFAAFSLHDEIEEAMEYARTYISVSQTPYRKVWYKLCTCPDANKSPSITILMELCFSLPFSNGRVENRFFQA